MITNEIIITGARLNDPAVYMAIQAVVVVGQQTRAVAGPHLAVGREVILLQRRYFSMRGDPWKAERAA